MNEYESNPESRIGRRMIWLAALGLLGVLYALFSMLEQGGGTVVSVDAGGAAMIVLEQDRNGHYQVEGQINNQSVNFLVDTGATAVAMNANQARRLGIDYRVIGRQSGVTTASGVEHAWAVTLDTVKVGDLELHNVGAVVLEGAHPATTLLGMTFLGRLEINNDGRLMTLRKKY